MKLLTWKGWVWISFAVWGFLAITFREPAYYTVFGLNLLLVLAQR